VPTREQLLPLPGTVHPTPRHNQRREVVGRKRREGRVLRHLPVVGGRVGPVRGALLLGLELLPLQVLEQCVVVHRTDGRRH
jgi:hypothetical protein